MSSSSAPSKSRRTTTPTTSDHRVTRAAALVAALLGGVLAVVALADQQGPQRLMEHAEPIYAAEGVDVGPGVLYGLLYTTSAVAVVVWLGVAGVVRSRARWMAPVAVCAALAVDAVLALALLLVREYDARIFPPVWGLLALLPVLPGLVALVRSLGDSRER